jgi:hypothetical protein
MISEEEKKLYAECVNCNTCLEWHHNCQAECCKIVFLNIDPSELDKPGRLLTIKPKDPIPFSDRRYFQLRDIECIRGFLRFKKERIVVVGRKVMYIHNCALLDGLLCKGHPDNKPQLCKALTLETAKLTGQPFTLTDNCLFKYKCKEVREDAR